MKNKINSPSSSSRRRSGVALETLADTINVDDEESKQTGTRSRASLSRPFNDEKGPTVFHSSVFRWKSTTEDVPESQSVSKIVQPRAVSNRTTITSVYIENTKKKRKKTTKERGPFHDDESITMPPESVPKIVKPRLVFHFSTKDCQVCQVPRCFRSLFVLFFFCFFLN